MCASVSIDGINFLREIFDDVKETNEVRIEDGMFVCWPFDNDLGYIKAFVSKLHAEKMIKNGAGILAGIPEPGKEPVPEPVEEIPESEPVEEFDDDAEPEDDKAIVTEKTHEETINDFSTNREVVQYVFDVTGAEINHRGKLEYVKKNALEAIESWQKQQDR